jgi:hypothetical protein
MKTLISNYLPNYSSEVVKFRTDGEDVRFKIVSENGNSYYYLTIAIQTRNRNFENVATFGDIPNVTKIQYHWDDEKRIQVAKENIKLAKKYITKVFSEE